jgi:hypothetical protein
MYFPPQTAYSGALPKHVPLELLNMILNKTPSNSDLKAISNLLDAGADPVRYLTCKQAPFIELVARGMSEDIPRQKIVQLLLDECPGRSNVFIFKPGFWDSFFTNSYLYSMWTPPSSPESIPIAKEFHLSTADKHMLWAMMTQTMADCCLKNANYEQTLLILKDVRKMGIEPKAEWLDLLLQRTP